MDEDGRLRRGSSKGLFMPVFFECLRMPVERCLEIRLDFQARRTQTMRAKIMLGSLACLALTACQSVLGFDTTPHEVVVSSGLYRVFEHPKGDRIMTKPSPAGIVTAMPGYPNFTNQAASDQTEAARRYLDDTGRSNCPIIFVREIAGPQFEFRFNCIR